nr:hypothetical protein [Okeania sp. SIO2F4]
MSLDAPKIPEKNNDIMLGFVPQPNLHNLRIIVGWVERSETQQKH